MSDTNIHLPVLPLRDVVIYPYMVIPLFVGREKSIAALDAAMNNNKKILLVAQKSAEIDDPSMEDTYDVGTLSTILQLLKLPDGTIKVLVEGVRRVKVESLESTGDYYTATVMNIVEEHTDERESEVLSRTLIDLFEQYVKLNKKVSLEVVTSLTGIDKPSKLADTVAAHMSLSLEEKQKVLGIVDVRARMEHLMG